MPELLTRLRDGVPELIDTPEQLAVAIESLGNSTELVAMDTERAQGFRYGSGAYLVQIRRRDVGTFLIDSRALPDLKGLSQVLSSTWIFHSAGQDLPALAELGMVAPRLFDTEVAARLLGTLHFSLLGVTEEYLGVTLEKAHQNENWSIRPLPTDWLRYAAMDVEVLPDLTDELQDQLVQRGRADWADQEFEYHRTHLLQPKENRWENLKGLGKLKEPHQRAIARELWEEREKIAVNLDLAPTRILSTRGIIDAALADPRRRRDLLSMSEFRRPRSRRYSGVWWNAVHRTHSLTEAEMPTLQPSSDPTVAPPFRQWGKSKPGAVPRLKAIRELVALASAPLEIEADVLLEPRVQRQVTWTPVADVSHLAEQLAAADARLWQQEQIIEATKEYPELLETMGLPD